MRILMVITNLNVGGAETQIVSLSNLLVEQGHDVKILTLLQPGSLVNKLNPEIAVLPLNISYIRGERFHFHSVIKILKGFIKAIVYLKILQPDIVHTHMFHATVFVRLISIFTTKSYKVVSTSHTTQDGGVYRNIVNRFTKRLSDLNTTVSEESLRVSLRAGTIIKKRSLYVSNGVVLSEEVPRHKISRITFRWIALGRLHPVKDYPNLIRAAAILQRMNLPFELNIYGEGPDERPLLSLIEEYKLVDIVNLKGRTDNSIHELLNSDGLVLSSLKEGLPMVVLEAATASLPIVATNVGGVGEVVKDGYTGFLCEANNSEDLAHSMFKLMVMSSENRTKLGGNCRRVVESAFDLKKVTLRWIDIYEKLLRGQVVA